CREESGPAASGGPQPALPEPGQQRTAETAGGTGHQHDVIACRVRCLARLLGFRVVDVTTELIGGTDVPGTRGNIGNGHFDPPDPVTFPRDPTCHPQRGRWHDRSNELEVEVVQQAILAW